MEQHIGFIGLGNMGAPMAGRLILPRTFDFGFSTGLAFKDLKLCLEEAEAAGVPMWVASAVRQLWFQAHHEFGPESDFTRIVQMIERWAGVEVRG